MAAKAGVHRSPGVGEGTGTTSTGVHYDTRAHPVERTPDEVRRDALARALAEQNKRKRARRPAKDRKRLINAALTVAVVALAAVFGALYGDRLWAELSAEPSKAAGQTLVLAEKQTEVPPEPTASQAAPPTDPPPSESPPAVAPTGAQPPAVETETKTVLVWIPQSGNRYHAKAECSGMKDPAPVPLDDAKARGLTPCKRCNPPG